MDGTIQLHAAYSVKWPRAQPFEKGAAHDQLIMTLVLSLALWLGIWGVVTSLISIEL